MSDGSLIVTETFMSIQGESTFAGLPCFFIRLAGCNLNCHYCDTLYSKNISDGREREIPELVDAALREKTSLVEITGGEPMTQKNVVPLCEKLLAEGLGVLMETNGSLPLTSLPDGVIKIIDCKTPSSGEHLKMDFSNYSILKDTDEIKFVISDYEDYKYALAIIYRYKLFEKTSRLLFSPAWDKIKIPELCEWMLRDKVPARLQLQMHKYIWGPDRKGV